MWILSPIWKEKTVYSGKNFDITQQNYSDWEVTKLFEFAKRAPWVRIIIFNKEKNKILLTKEYRNELDQFDYRLPWWKVFDTPAERKNANYSKIEEYAKQAAIKECREETGLIVSNIKLLWVSHAGATVTWDLYYFITDSIIEATWWQELESGEVITQDWYSTTQILNLIKDWKMQEDRTIWMLFKFFLENNSIQTT